MDKREVTLRVTIKPKRKNTTPPASLLETEKALRDAVGGLPYVLDVETIASRNATAPTERVTLEEIPASVGATLRTVGDAATFDHAGFNVRVDVEADNDAGEDHVGVVLRVVRHVEVHSPTTGHGSYVTERDVVLGGASLWGIDSLEDDYARDVCVDLLHEALTEARGVLAILSGVTS